MGFDTEQVRVRSSSKGAVSLRIFRPRQPGILVAGFLIALAACAPQPHGVAVNDPSLRELLRPTEPVESERLVRAGGEVFYEATLRRYHGPGFRARYLQELYDRGFSIWPGGTSPHDVMQRITGYNVRVVQEAALEPYTIRYRTTWNGNGAEESFWRLVFQGWNFPHPVSVSGRRVVVRLSSDFLKPWTTRVLVPDHSLVAPPDDFPLPLPPTGVLVGVDDGRKAGHPRVELDVVARIPSSQVIAFYQQLLAGISRDESDSDKSDSSGIGLFPLGDVRPAWVPRDAVVFYVSAQTSLFAAPRIMVNDARFPNFLPPGARDNGQYQPATLKHIPPDARMYWISVSLK